MDLIWIFVDATLSSTPEGGFNWKMRHGQSRLDGGGNMQDEGGEVLPDYWHGIKGLIRQNLSPAGISPVSKRHTKYKLKTSTA